MSKLAIQITILLLVAAQLVADEAADPVSPNREVRSTQLANDWVDAYIRSETARISNDLSALEGAELLAPKFGDSSADANVLLRPVTGSLSDITSGLNGPINELDDELREVSAQWKQLRSLEISRVQERAKIEGAVTTFGLLAHLFDSKNRWIWFCALFAVLCLGGAVLHDRRHDFRKRLVGTKAKSLRVVLVLKFLTGALGTFTIVVFLFGDTIHASLIAQGGEVPGNSLSSIQNEIEEFNQTPRALLLNPNTNTQGLSITSVENDVRLKVQQAVIKYKLLVGVYTKMLEHYESFKESNDWLINHEDERSSNVFRGRIIRFAISGGLLGIVAYVALTLKRHMWKREKINGETCPSCLMQDSLVGVDDVAGGPLRCNNMVPDPKHKGEYKECGLVLQSTYKKLPKICFPTLGHVATGKTHWLAMAYRELKNFDFGSKANFATIKDGKTSEFNSIVQDIIKNGKGTSATQVKCVDPLMFHFTDNDRFGKTDVLLSLFDYSGEISDRDGKDSLRQRALDADGYLFFLDPTIPAEHQKEALINLSEEVKIQKGVDRGRTIQVPLAICVSKIDLLINRDKSLGGGILKRFHKELMELDPNGDDYSMEIIDACSSMMERYVTTIWDGWNVSQDVDRIFDGRFRFFPLTPVGLHSIGQEELKYITQMPYRVLHPLLWLLQMNGFHVFDKHPKKR
jgi:hypothetical protein